LTKRLLIPILLLFVLAVVGSIYYYNSEDGSSETIVEAIEKVREESYVSYIIHQEPVEGGVVVFYRRDTKDGIVDVSAEFVRKTRSGWKWGFGGGFSTSTDNDYHAYFPSTEGSEFGDSPFPMLFGVVVNPEASRVVIKDKVRGLQRQAKLVEVNRKFKLYFVFLDKSEGKKFEITSYNDNEQIIRRESIDESLTSQSSEGDRLQVKAAKASFFTL
jgi:hypothetical protein